MSLCSRLKGNSALAHDTFGSNLCSLHHTCQSYVRTCPMYRQDRRPSICRVSDLHCRQRKACKRPLRRVQRRTLPLTGAHVSPTSQCHDYSDDGYVRRQTDRTTRPVTSHEDGARRACRRERHERKGRGRGDKFHHSSQFAAFQSIARAVLREELRSRIDSRRRH